MLRHARGCVHVHKGRSTSLIRATVLLSSWPEQNWRIRPTRRLRAGFRKFSGKKSCIARARRGRARLTVYPPRIQIRDVAISIARRDHRKSKFGLRHAIKLTESYGVTKSEFWFSIAWLRTSDLNVRNLDPGRVNCFTRAAAPRARDAWIFFENLRNPARNRRAGLMRQFCSGQLDSSPHISGGKMVFM